MPQAVRDRERPPVEISQRELRRLANSQEVIHAQDGPQYTFLQSRADIGIYGGAAGGG